MNSVQLIGRLTRDPEALRFTTGGTATTTVRLAVSRPKKDGAEQPAVFVDVVTYGTLAETVAEHLTLGREVGVTGRLDYREWEADDGSKRSKHEVVAAQIDFLRAGKDQADSPEAAAEEPF
jgi:single-strand DNA-binding protein